jgi:undecaprenyl-diphosphatase
MTTTLLTAGCVWITDLTTLALKALVERPRPVMTVPEADPLLGGTLGNSFPSGHAATSFAGLVILAFLIRRAIPFLVVLAVLISFSRIYIGVHYPLDVVGGAAIGSALAVALAYALRAPPMLSKARRRSAEAPPPG